MNVVCAQDGRQSTARWDSFTIDVHRQGYYAAKTIRSGEPAPLGFSLKGHSMTAIAYHPGEVLAHKLEALGVKPTELARQLHVPANRITQIVNGKRGITGDSALRLAHWFGDDPEYWMALQARYDLQIAAKECARHIRLLPTATRAKGQRQTQVNRTRTNSENRRPHKGAKS